MARAPVPVAVRMAPHALAGAACAGIAVSMRVPAAPAAGAAAALALAALAAAAVARRAPAVAVAALCAAVLAGGWAWGTARLDATAPAPAPAGGLAEGVLVVDAPSVPDGHGGRRMRAVVERLDGPDGPALPAGARVLLTVRGADPPPGARLAVAGRVRAAADSASPGWWRRWLERQGIAARMGVRAPAQVGRRGGIAGVRDRWRTWAADRAGAGLHGDTAGVVRGMALGGGSQLSQEAADAFRDAGIWHLLAVSGQNVTVVALAVLALLRALGAAHRPAVAAAAVVMLAYCLACDGGASVARAGTVGALALLAELRGGARERWMLLLAGLALLLAWQPRALLDPGLQLSFAAVAGLFACAPPLAARLRGVMPAPVAELTAMAVAAGLATAPVIAAHFGRLSLVGFAVNIVAVPLAAPVVVLALAGIAAGAAVPAAGVLAAHCAGLGADLLLVTARAASAVPGATAPVGAGAVAPLAALALAPALAGWWRDAAPGARAPRIRAAAVAAAAVAAGWALSPVPAPAAWPPAPALTALDVGQGDAILLRGPAGEALLVDAGPPGDPPPVVAALRRHGVTRLDALLVTHPDADHVGGAPAVLAAVPVGALLHGPAPADGWNEGMRAALDAAAARGVRAVAVRAGDALAAGPWRARVLWPAGAPAVGIDANDASVVAHAAAGPLTVLLTGDAESGVTGRLPLAPAHVLKVAHHGSDDPALRALLHRLRPRVAVISAGAGNAFGHPRPAVLEELRAAGARVLRTDRDGDVTVTAAAP